MGFINVIKEIITNRRLLFDLSKKDFKKKFSGTIFGVGWAFIQPTLSILVYVFAFQYGFKSPDIAGMPYAMWFTCGIIPWIFINEGISTASNSFLEYDYLIKKVRFNITILPLVKVMSALYIHCFFLVVLFIMTIIYRIQLTLMFLQILYYLVCSVCILFSFTLFTSTIVVFFKDFNQIISLLLLIGMWATPIAWDINNLGEGSHFIFKLNPFYYIIEGYRDSFLNRTWFWDKPLLSIYFWFIVFASLIIGGFVFYRLKGYFAESV